MYVSSSVDNEDFQSYIFYKIVIVKEKKFTFYCFSSKGRFPKQVFWPTALVMNVMNSVSS